MDITLAKIGIVCIIAAIVGGTLKAASIEFGTLESTGRQLLLASFGIILIFIHWLRERGEDTADQAQGEPPRLVMIVGGILLGVAFAALLSALYGSVKAGALSSIDIWSASRRAVVDGHVVEFGAILGAVCGASWSFLQRRMPGAAVTMVILAGAVLGWSVTRLNPDGLRFETTAGIIRATAFGAAAALIVVLVLRRLRV
jgi:hypothetical protein